MECNKKDHSLFSSTPYDNQGQSYVACYLEQQGQIANNNNAREPSTLTSVLPGNHNMQLSNYQQRFNECNGKRYSNSVSSTWASSLNSYQRQNFSTTDSTIRTSCLLSPNVSSCMRSSQHSESFQTLLSRHTDSWIQDLSEGKKLISHLRGCSTQQLFCTAFKVTSINISIYLSTHLSLAGSSNSHSVVQKRQFFLFEKLSLQYTVAVALEG